MKKTLLMLFVTLFAVTAGMAQEKPYTVVFYNLENLFDKKEFEYIIIDECHHAVADTYRKIINYFEPEFLLGLTATEDRMGV